MAQNNITIGDGFHVTADKPLDDRTSVENGVSELHEMQNAYCGLITYVGAKDEFYYFNGTEWKELTNRGAIEEAIRGIIDMIGLPGGIASLGEDGKVPAEQLPKTVVSREYSIDFGDYTDVANEGNVVNTLYIVQMVLVNVAKLQCVFGGAVHDVVTLTNEQIESLKDATTGELQEFYLQLDTPLIIPPKTGIKWLVYRIDNGSPASATLNFNITL